MLLLRELVRSFCQCLLPSSVTEQQRGRILGSQQQQPWHRQESSANLQHSTARRHLSGSDEGGLPPSQNSRGLSDESSQHRRAVHTPPPRALLASDCHRKSRQRRRSRAWAWSGPAERLYLHFPQGLEISVQRRTSTARSEARPRRLLRMFLLAARLLPAHQGGVEALQDEGFAPLAPQQHESEWLHLERNRFGTIDGQDCWDLFAPRLQHSLPGAARDRLECPPFLYCGLRRWSGCKFGSSRRQFGNHYQRGIERRLRRRKFGSLPPSPRGAPSAVGEEAILPPGRHGHAPDAPRRAPA
mmetsp:Transcript_45544/g.97659  ORF Transcript_45544/g.97659 Transcript_45544/m.97659 type:complete len:300 (-) Transcript_45544:160-1059(-)